MCTGLIATGSCRGLTFTLVTLALAAIWLDELWPQGGPALTFILPAMAFSRRHRVAVGICAWGETG